LHLREVVGGGRGGEERLCQVEDGLADASEGDATSVVHFGQGEVNRAADITPGKQALAGRDAGGGSLLRGRRHLNGFPSDQARLFFQPGLFCLRGKGSIRATAPNRRTESGKAGGFSYNCTTVIPGGS
jgi:hypothetical protein